ncbi:MAG: hypothetical protein ACI4A8_10690 [Muribaculaceae bacterium]
MKRFLAQYVVTDSAVLHLHLVSVDSSDNVIDVAPFAGEVHSTQYVNGIIVVSSRHVAECCAIFRNYIADSCDLKSAAQRIADFLVNRSPGAPDLSCRKAFIIE